MHPRSCRALAALTVTFGVGAVLALALGAWHPTLRGAVLATTAAIIFHSAASLCAMAWMMRRWLLPLSVTWRMAQREALRGAVQRREHLQAVD